MGITEDDEDTHLVIQTMSVFDKYKNKQRYTFLTPGGKPITLPFATQSVRIGEVTTFSSEKADSLIYIPLGILTNFTINDVTYNASCDKGFTQFINYVGSGKDKKGYIDTLTKKLLPDERKAIVAYPCINRDLVSLKVSVMLFGQRLTLEFGIYRALYNGRRHPKMAGYF